MYNSAHCYIATVVQPLIFVKPLLVKLLEVYIAFMFICLLNKHVYVCSKIVQTWILTGHLCLLEK